MKISHLVTSALFVSAIHASPAIATTQTDTKDAVARIINQRQCTGSPNTGFTVGGNVQVRSSGATQVFYATTTINDAKDCPDAERKFLEGLLSQSK